MDSLSFITKMSHPDDQQENWKKDEWEHLWFTENGYECADCANRR